MTRKICWLFGHHRDKRRAVPHGYSWRSRCTRCGTLLERIAPGQWTVVTDIAQDPASPHPGPPSPLQVPDPAGESANPVLIEWRLAGPPRRKPAETSEYYTACAEEARRLAGAETDASIQLIHLEMALRYDLLARLAPAESRPIHAVR